MRWAVTFLSGFVTGAAAILIYLQASEQLAITAHPPEPVPLAASVPSTQTSGPSWVSTDETAILVPVQGIPPEALRSNFLQKRGQFRVHQALDIMAPRGTPVVASVDGTIRKLFTSRAGGLTIYEFDQNSEKVYYYAHLDRYAAAIKEGMPVKRGDVIGYVGTTGNAPPGAPHLHFAIALLPPGKEWWKGEPVDPYPLLAPALGSAR